MNVFKMSLFYAPISPVKNERGQTITPASLYPSKALTVEEVYKLITTDKSLCKLTEIVRAAAGNDKEFRAMKQQCLPYVTPCGTFTYRKSDHLLVPSGLVVVDIDHLDSHAEATSLRRKLFDDKFLRPSLVFVSPSGRGVKAFVPYDLHRIPDIKQNISENIYWVMNYVQLTYGDSDSPAKDKGVDTSGKDVVRACFLSYDKGALFRRS